MKRKMLFVAMLLISVFAFASVASAVDWVTCSVQRAGVNTAGDTQILLKVVSAPSTLQSKLSTAGWTTNTGAATDLRWFLATGDTAKSMLAVALSAMASGTNAFVGFTGGFDQWKTIYSISLMEE